MVLKYLELFNFAAPSPAFHLSLDITKLMMGLSYLPTYWLAYLFHDAGYYLKT
jgi:hypothetical protein